MIGAFVLRRNPLTMAAAIVAATIVVGTAASAGPAAPGDLVFMSNRGGPRYEYFRMSADGRQVVRLGLAEPIVEGLVLSPDGRHAAFAGGAHNQPQNIIVASLVDGSTRQITREPLPVFEPQWAPDGRRIAYVKAAEGGRKIFIADADGTNVRKLTTMSDSDELSPRFSPDGRMVAFLAATPSAPPRVWIVDVATGTSRQLNPDTRRRLETPPTWSPDGQRVVFSTIVGQTAHLVTVRPDGSDLRQLTQGDERNSEARWSPDGTQLLFLALAGSVATVQLHAIAADGSGRRVVRRGPNNVLDGRWSLDGSRIYFAEHTPGGGQIFEMPAGGGEARRLSNGEGFDVNIEICCQYASPAFASLR